MSCTKVAILPSGFLPLTLQAMSYPQQWSRTVFVNSPRTPTPSSSSSSSPYPSYPSSAQPSPSSAMSPGPSKRYSRGYASEIVPRLYISDLSFAESASQLSSHRITHIVSVLPEAVAIPPESALPRQPYRIQINVEDFPFAELAAHLPYSTKFIHDALRSDPEARVLVHCAEGVSRSVSVVAAYLMAAFSWSPKDALAYIKQRRPIANPNFGFIQQLHEYGRDQLGQRLEVPRV